MNADDLDALFAKLTAQRTRRGVLAILGGLGAWGGLAGIEAKRKKNRNNRKRRKRRKSGSSKPPLPPINVACPGPPDTSTSSFPDFGQFAQNFLVPRSGQLTSAQCEVTNVNEGADFTLDIRTIDPLSGQPTGNVLASVTLPDRPATPSPQTLLLAATFNPPAPVEAGDGYALVVSIGAGQTFSLMFKFGNPCPGQLFVANDATPTYTTIGGDMTFTATIV